MEREIRLRDFFNCISNTSEEQEHELSSKRQVESSPKLLWDVWIE